MNDEELMFEGFANRRQVLALIEEFQKRDKNDSIEKIMEHCQELIMKSKKAYSLTDEEVLTILERTVRDFELDSGYGFNTVLSWQLRNYAQNKNKGLDD